MAADYNLKKGKIQSSTDNWTVHVEMQKTFYYTTKSGQKRSVEVYCGELEELELRADLLVCSAFLHNYRPSRSSLIGTLDRAYGISVEALAAQPEIDMQEFGIWISKPIADAPFRRIACLEMEGKEQKLQSYFETVFFALASGNRRGCKIKTIALPLVGTGNQAMNPKDIFVPLIAESLYAFEFVEELEKIIFFERDEEKYRYMCEYLTQELETEKSRSYFISYSHKDAAAANLIADILERNGMKVWIDHKKIRNANYPEEIIRAMEASSAFIILVSASAQNSVDVKRELRNAGEFERTVELQILPIRLDREEFTPEVRYYLAGKNYYELLDVTEEAVAEICRKVAEASLPKRNRE